MGLKCKKKKKITRVINFSFCFQKNYLIGRIIIFLLLWNVRLLAIGYLFMLYLFIISAYSKVPYILLRSTFRLENNARITA